MTSEFEEIYATPPSSWSQARQDAVAALLHRIRTGSIPEDYKEIREAEKIKDFTDTRKRAEVIALKGEPIELPPSMAQRLERDPDTFALRFLMARLWHVADATKMVITASQYRLTQGLDSKPLFPTYLHIQGWTQEELKASRGIAEDRGPSELDQRAAMNASVYQAGWHKTDKFGCPVWIERTGKGKGREHYALNQKINPPGTTLAGMADAARPAHVYNGEVGLAIVKCENDRRKLKGLPPVHQITTIRDLTGLSLVTLHNPTINFFKEVAKYDKENSGEGIARVYIVNAPAMFTVVWAMIKLWLDERTLKKIKIIGPKDTPKVLLEIIDEENLPEFLGGKCTCGGPSLADQKAADDAAAESKTEKKKLECFCVPDLADPDPSAASGLGDTQIVQVKAGKVGTVEFEIQKPDETIVWEYAVDGGKTADVQFRAQYHAGGGGPPQNIVIEGDGAMSPDGVTPKTVRGSGTFTSPTRSTPGEKIVFSFDNSFSWMTGKTVQFRVTPADAATGALESQPLESGTE